MRVCWNWALFLVHFHLTVYFRHYLIILCSCSWLRLLNRLKDTINESLLLSFNKLIIRILSLVEWKKITSTISDTWFPYYDRRRIMLFKPLHWIWWGLSLWFSCCRYYHLTWTSTHVNRIVIKVIRVFPSCVFGVIIISFIHLLSYLRGCAGYRALISFKYDCIRLHTLTVIIYHSNVILTSSNLNIAFLRFLVLSVSL